MRSGGVLDQRRIKKLISSSLLSTPRTVRYVDEISGNYPVIITSSRQVGREMLGGLIGGSSFRGRGVLIETRVVTPR